MYLALSASFMLAAASTAGTQNLVVNGSFEEPDISPSALDFRSSIPGWTLVNGGAIELWRGSFYGPTSAEGAQHVELDGHESTSISQDISTPTGQRYRVSFSFSPRPDVVGNRLVATWNGVVIADLEANGFGLQDCLWARYAYIVLPSTTGVTSLAFADASISDGLGTLLDDVVVESVCGGDTNDDGFVGFADLNNILAVFNATTGDVLYIPRLDLDADGQIGFSDLNLVLSGFNQPCP